VEKDKIHVDDELSNNEDENDQFNSSVFDNSNQPEWMELVHPNKQFEEIDSDFSFDNGGPDFDWSKTSYEYPNDSHLLLQNLDNDPNLRNIPFSLTMSYHHL
jgi:hypothetical protein